MLTIKVHRNIEPDNFGWFCMCDEECGAFSLEMVQHIFETHPEDTDVRFNIHSNGGSIEEAFAIYDFLRTSGRNIYTNIEGSCHSAAVVLLLAAPAENRTANANALSIIHKVSGEVWGDVDDVESYAERMRMLQDKMIDIYADRTKLGRDRLAEIVDEQKERTAAELLEWGFISRINPYITNYAQPIQNVKMDSIKTKLMQVANEIGNLLGITTQQAVVTNYDFVDADDKVVFSTEGETADLTEGMEAAPDGIFTLKDGRTVTIEKGKIAKIESEVKDETEPTNDVEPTPAEPISEPAAPINDTMAEELEKAKAEIANLTASMEVKDAENKALAEKLTEAHATIMDIAKGIKSTKVIGTRMSVAESPATNKAAAPSREELAKALEERMKNR